MAIWTAVVSGAAVSATRCGAAGSGGVNPASWAITGATQAGTPLGSTLAVSTQAFAAGWASSPGKYTWTRLSTNGPSGFTNVIPAGSEVRGIAVASAPDHKGASLIARNHCGSPWRGLKASDWRCSAPWVTAAAGAVARASSSNVRCAGSV